MPMSFRETLKSGHFAITAELTVRRETTASDVRRQADKLGKYVDALQVTDNPYAWVQMSALAAAGVLADHGVDPVPVLTCRDRNRAALHGDLLGLQALGVSSLMLMRGPRVPRNHAVQASTVFDLTGRELIALASSLNESKDESAGFFIGTGAKVFRPRPGWRAESLTARADAGARFIQTQLCFNMDILRRYMERFSEAKLDEKYPLLVSLSPLPSAVTAKWVKEHMADSRIPQTVLKRLEDASHPEQEGIRICAELIEEISEIPGISGVHLMTTGDPETIPAVIEASGVRAN